MMWTLRQHLVDLKSSSTLRRALRWPEVYRNATYGRLIFLVSRSFVRNDHLRSRMITSLNQTLLSGLLVPTHQRIFWLQQRAFRTLDAIGMHKHKYISVLRILDTRLIANGCLHVKILVFRIQSIICITIVLEKKCYPWLFQPFLLQIDITVLINDSIESRTFHNHSSSPRVFFYS